MPKRMVRYGARRSTMKRGRTTAKEDPPMPNNGNEEENLLEDSDSTQSRFSSTTVDREIGNKGKYPEMEHIVSRRKKMKSDRNENIISLDNEDMQIMTEEIAKAAQTRFKTIEE